MADISALGGLQPSEPLDFDTYKDVGEGRPLPKKGRYTVQAPESFSFGVTNAGALSAQVDPTIVGPTNEGYRILFTRVSAKPFKRGGVSVSHLGDYLRACGRRGKLSGEQELADAVEETANTTYEVDVDWRVYEKGTGYVLEGMENFPSDGNGGHIPVIESPTEKNPETGEPARLRANLVVTRYVPATA